MPSELWHWTEDFGAPRAEMAAWRGFDTAAGLRALLPVPISVENDSIAACRAELVFGPQTHKQDFIHFFVGTLIGGGIVLNGSVFPGRRGTSGGFGPLRIPDEPGGHRLVARVIEELHRLDLQGVTRPEVTPGRFGAVARALGAASWRISMDYMINRNALQADTTAPEPPPRR